MSNEYDAGMGTSPGMWEMVSEALDGEKLPDSVNAAIYALVEGKAEVRPKIVRLSEQEIDLLHLVPIFADVPRDQLGWIVRRVEHEHRIGMDEAPDCVGDYLLRKQEPGAPA